MADSSWDSVKDSIIDGIKNPLTKDGETVDAAGVTFVDPENPLDIGAFAKTIVGTLIALLTVGVSGILQAILNAIEGFPRGLGSFVTDAVTAVLSLPGELLATAADTTAAAVETFGVLAYPLAVAVVLATLYIVSKAVKVIR